MYKQPTHEGDLIEEVAMLRQRIAQLEDEKQQLISDSRKHILTTLFDKFPHGMILVERDGTIIATNRSFFGIPVTDMIGRNFFDYTMDDNHKTVSENIEKVFLNRQPSSYILPHPVHDGAPLWYETQITPIIQDDVVSCAILMVCDVTHRTLQEQRLQHDSKRILTAKQIAQMGSWEYNMVTGETVFSRTTADILGILCENEFIESHVSEYLARVHPDDLEMARQSLENSRKYPDKNFPITVRIRRESGVDRLVYIEGTVIGENANGDIVRVGMIQDITDQKQRETELIEQTRVDLTRQFIADVSHEFRTPLSIISTSLFRLRRLTDLLMINDHVDILEIALDDVVHLIDGLTILISLDQMSEIYRKTIDLKALVSGCYDQLLSDASKKNQRLSIQLPPTPCITNIDSYYFTKVINEVVQNAIKFTSEGGHIDVSLYSDENAHQIIVTDTGIGIDKSELPYIFDRFYRVKQDDYSRRGLGLGLAISQKIVRLHGGKVSVESVFGEGCTFTITIPNECQYH